MQQKRKAQTAHIISRFHYNIFIAFEWENLPLQWIAAFHALMKCSAFFFNWISVIFSKIFYVWTWYFQNASHALFFCSRSVFDRLAGQFKPLFTDHFSIKLFPTSVNCLSKCHTEFQTNKLHFNTSEWEKNKSIIFFYFMLLLLRLRFAIGIICMSHKVSAVDTFCNSKIPFMD